MTLDELRKARDKAEIIYLSLANTDTLGAKGMDELSKAYREWLDLESKVKQAEIDAAYSEWRGDNALQVG
jgi:hypothetical protein